MELIGHTNVFRLIGDMLHLLSVLIILQKMLKLRSCSGLSLKSQLAYAIVFTTRYLPTIVYSTSLYIIFMKLFFLLSSWYIVFLMRTRNPWKASYDEKFDSFKMRYLIVPCVLLALVFHYERPHAQIPEMLWTFSEYLEAVAIIPQLSLLTTTLAQGRQWELLTSHYVLCLGLYRAFYVMNWIYRYVAENRWNYVDSSAGIIQTLLYSEFFYTYLKGMRELRRAMQEDLS
ncbi:ER lumen protein-retaining receptor [Diplonema papillatum]|nr:ER lumen protein-retaining receptor [Diplonema papillatum]